jgi:hypothetical protein
MSERDRPRVYAVGPFSFDEGCESVTLAAGRYILSTPIVLGLVKETRIQGIEYGPLLNRDAGACPADGVIAEHGSSE